VTDSTQANVRQVLDGYRITEGLETRCDRCNRQLGECACVTVAVQRLTAEETWSLASTWCVACADHTIKRPTSGVDEVLAEARLGVLADGQAQRHWLVLVRPIVIDASTLAEDRNRHCVAQKGTEHSHEEPSCR
jgi:hypothetical protein